MKPWKSASSQPVWMRLNIAKDIGLSVGDFTLAPEPTRK